MYSFWIFISIYTHITTNQIKKMYNIFNIPEDSFCPLIPVSSLGVTTILILLVLELQNNGITYMFSFVCDLFIITSVRVIYVTLLFFPFSCIVSHYMSISLFIHSLDNCIWVFSSFWLLWIDLLSTAFESSPDFDYYEYDETLKSFIVFLYLFLLDVYLRIELLGQNKCMFNFTQ